MACPPNCHLCLSRNKETPVIDDSNCHCGPCTAMNEPLTLEGDIRYLKAHIETKDRQLADANKRAEIYRDALIDAVRENTQLREENEKMKQRSTEQNDWLVRLQEENKKLRKEKETLANDRASLVGEANELYEAIGRISGIVNEIID